MELARLARTSVAVAATRSRSTKVGLLSQLARDLGGPDTEAAVGLMIGELRQGKIGLGWSTIAKLELTPADSPSLSVQTIDELFDELAATNGPGSVARRHELLTDTLRHATAEELDFLRRVIIGDLRQGALASLVCDAIAVASEVPSAIMRRAWMLQGNLGETALIALTQGIEGLSSIALEVGRAIEPMLASTATDAAEALAATGPALVEWKLDGARIQVHREGDVVRVFTRNLNDVTDRVPEVVRITRTFPVERLVLDGEVIGYTDLGAPQAFQETMSTFGTDEADSSNSPLRPFFFDAMLIGERELLDEPLHTRRSMMLGVVGEHSIPAIETEDSDAASHHLKAAMAAGHEGVMVKALDSPYEAGRRGKSWRKIKPVHTLDLVVLAAEWGHGRRNGWLSNLHLGARNPSPSGPAFLMVGKTFKGLTDELLTWQTVALLDLETHRDGSGHTVFVAPELVVEIAVDGAQVSSRYPGGVALRFARVRGYRPDREPNSADLIDDVRALLPDKRPRAQS